MKKCVVLLSGGIDSAATLALANAEGCEVHALTVTYGQRHLVELESARKIAEHFGVKEHMVVNVELDKLGGSALTGSSDIPKDRYTASAEIPPTYVPARNTVLLSIALAYAETINAIDLYIGVNAVDYSGYPDCRPQFILAYETLARVATKVGVEGAKVQIHAPLIHMSKAQIVKKALELGIDPAWTHSCYDPDDQGRACGRCDSCIIRSLAFDSLGMQDPALAHL